MLKIRKRLAIAFARNFAAGLVENAEVGCQDVGLSEDEMEEARLELIRISKRIEATVNSNLLEALS